MKVYVHVILDGQRPWTERQYLMGRAVGWKGQIINAGHTVLDYTNFGGRPEEATITKLAEVADVIVAFCIGPLSGFGGSMREWLDNSTKPCVLVFESLEVAGESHLNKPLICLSTHFECFIGGIANAPSFYRTFRKILIS